MNFEINIDENTVTTDLSFTRDYMNDGKLFPVLNIGRGSYVGGASVISCTDENLIYNLQIGRYTSIAGGITFMIDLNHDYKRYPKVEYLTSHIKDLPILDARDKLSLWMTVGLDEMLPS